MHTRKNRVSAPLNGGDTAPGPVDEVDQGNAVLVCQILDKTALAAFLAVTTPAGPAAHREILAADGDRPAIDPGHAHHIRCRRERVEVRTLIASLPGQSPDLLERAFVNHAGNALANREPPLGVMLCNRLRAT